MNKILINFFLIVILVGVSGCSDNNEPNSNIGSNPENPQSILSGTPQTKVSQDEYYIFTPNVDPSQGKLTYTITNKPEWAEFDLNRGTLKGIPNNNDVGITNGIVISAFNGSVSFSLAPFNIEVIDVNDPPIIRSQPADLSLSKYVYQIVAEDPEKNSVLTYTLIEGPAGMTVSSNGLLEWQPVPGSYNVKISVADAGNLSAIQTFTITPSIINQPFFSSVPITQVAQNNLYIYQAKTVGLPGDVTFRVERGPKNMSISRNTGLIEWQPLNEDVGQIPILLVASNSAGQVTRQEFVLTVLDSNDSPVISSTPPNSVSVNSIFQYQISARDPDQNNTLNYELKRGPMGMVLSESGQLTWVPTSTDIGIHRITLAISDSAVPRASTIQEFNLNVVGTNNQNEKNFIAITSIPNYVALRGVLYIYQVIAVGPGRLSYSLTDAPQGMTIDDNGLIKWIPEASHPDSVTVKLSVNSIDTPAIPATQDFSVLIPSNLAKTSWKILFVDSQENLSASLAIDGNPSTSWHTQFSRKQPPPPHEVQIDLGQRYDMAGLTYLPTQDLNANGRVKEFEIYVSEDGTNWGIPVAVGSFVNDATEKNILFPPTPGRFVRFVAINDVKNTPFTSAAELGILGVPALNNSPPIAKIDEPATDLEISVGQTITLRGSGIDPDVGQKVNYFWSFDALAANSTNATPDEIQFNQEGTFVIWLTVTDDIGRSDTTPEKRIIKVTNGHSEISKSQTTVQFVDSQDSSAKNGEADAINAIDGNIATNWISNSLNAISGSPHEIQLNLGSAFMIDGIRYFPRQNTGTTRIGDYRIYVSPDGIEWGPPVLLGAFPNDESEKHLLFQPLWGQFIRFVARNSIDGGGQISVAELGVEGVCEKPYLKILSPKARAFISSGSLHVTSSVCIKSGQDWGVKFILDNSLEIIDQAPPFEATFPGLSRSEHTIEAFLIDRSGKQVPGQHTFDKVENIGVGDYYVALGDSITAGVGDNDPTDNSSKDNRNENGGFTPILANALVDKKNYPQLVVNEGLPGETGKGGLLRLPEVIKGHPESQFFLIMYGTNDSSGSTPPPSGLGLEVGQPGYEGSYKSTMQQIINLVINSGKKPFLAKIPFGQTTNSRIALIKEYNKVIDELVASNGISVIPPDFYSYFELNQNQLSDKLHPNGAGYKQMANLWLNNIQ